MMFTTPLLLFGSALRLETIRRGYIGGSALSLFIIKEFGLDKQAKPTLDYMRTFLDLEQEALDAIPPFMDYLIYPFTDFHLAAKTFLEMLEMMAENQRPSTCQYYWDKEKKL